jgi:hypothetical protein
MTLYKSINNCYLLNKNDDTLVSDSLKTELYNDCTEKTKYDISLKKKLDDYKLKKHKYKDKKKRLNKLRNNKISIDEELNNNSSIVNFLVVETRIILGVLILLIFLIYKYILK